MKHPDRCFHSRICFEHTTVMSRGEVVVIPIHVAGREHASPENETEYEGRNPAFLDKAVHVVTNSFSWNSSEEHLVCGLFKRHMGTMGAKSMSPVDINCY